MTKLEDMLARFHRNACYPEAMPGELSRAAAEVTEYFRAQWVACEACGGTGEIIMRAHGARDPSDEHAMLCPTCEGTGRDCVDGSTQT